ncbi:unnamed protein product [Lactuca virosa]|uniref:Uncharacterized protein n=1 Tax=Lactuca virosa TaxID=75947 RepID=A0AAU9MZK1_9ASTR|nr:unnamed protein product [Lactuca virosa]
MLATVRYSPVSAIDEEPQAFNIIPNFTTKINREFYKIKSKFISIINFHNQPSFVRLESPINEHREPKEANFLQYLKCIPNSKALNQQKRAPRQGRGLSFSSSIHQSYKQQTRPSTLFSLFKNKRSIASVYKR